MTTQKPGNGLCSQIQSELDRQIYGFKKEVEETEFLEIRAIYSCSVIRNLIANARKRWGRPGLDGTCSSRGP